LIDLGFVTGATNIKIAARANIKSNKPKINKMSKTSKFQAILNAFKGKVVNKVIFSADEKEINFPDVAEDGVIEVGSRATLEGAAIGGTEEEPIEIVGQDTMIYVFVDSIVTEIKEAEEVEEEEEVSEDEMFDALVATLEVAAEIEERVSVLEIETVAVKKERDEFKTKLDNALATIAKLKGSSTTPETVAKDKGDKKDTVSSVTAQWKQNRLNKQKQK